MSKFMKSAAEAPASLPPENVTVTISLTMPVHVAAAIQKQVGDDVAITDHMIATTLRFGRLPHEQRRGLYLDDATHNEIDEVLGKSTSTSEELVARIRTLAAFKVSGIRVSIDPDDVDQLLANRYDTEEAPEAYLSRVVRTGILAFLQGALTLRS